jgi:hypothetical protein
VRESTNTFSIILYDIGRKVIFKHLEKSIKIAFDDKCIFISICKDTPSLFYYQMRLGACTCIWMCVCVCVCVCVCMKTGISDGSRGTRGT